MLGEGVLFTLHSTYGALDAAVDCSIALGKLQRKRFVGRMGVNLI